MQAIRSLFVEPNWAVVTIVGAVVGALAQKYGSLVLYPLRRLKQEPLIGAWYDYHFTFLNGNRYVAESPVLIRHGRLTGISVEINDQDVVSESGSLNNKRRDGLTYRGTLRHEGPHLVVEANGVRHTELLVFRFIYRLPSNDAVIPGVWMSFDHDMNPTAGLMILSRKRLRRSAAIKFLMDSAHIDDGVIQVQPSAKRGRNYPRESHREASEPSTAVSPSSPKDDVFESAAFEASEIRPSEKDKRV